MLSSVVIMLYTSNAAAHNMCVRRMNARAVPVSMSAKLPDTFSGLQTRRSALCGLATAAALPTLLRDPASAATLLSNEDKALLQVKTLAVKARRLKEAVRSKGAASAERVKKERESVLRPLLVEMERGAPILQYLSAEEFESAQLQPQFLKGHLSELDFYFSKPNAFDVYTSKTTGSTYPGGKVERELEEVVETCDDFLALSKKYFAGKAAAGPFVAAKK
jgi:hypothetical protein